MSSHFDVVAQICPSLYQACNLVFCTTDNIGREIGNNQNSHKKLIR